MSQPNILFIMCDQLRWDYLSCYGHPHLQTPNIDRLAEQGVRFERAYVQSPICGPSRAATYTGRYLSSHGASLNYVPLPIGERFLGDYLAPLGVRTALVGKTHLKPDLAAMQLLGIEPSSAAGKRLAEGAFEPYWRDDGLHPNARHSRETDYNRYLRAQGYEGDNPWHTHANGALDEEGEFRSGWFLENAPYAANIEARHSETPYATMRAMEFIEEAGEQAWCLHLSYIKPHWPYIAPAPYHKMYGKEQILPANRSESERSNPHPIYEGYMKHQSSFAFVSDESREAVIPVYMGLIKQIDDQIGRLLDFLAQRGQLDNTVIVFTSDHGDYLGDHWLGEKDFFHEEAVRVPLIIFDPRAEADCTRGTTCKQLVESIDLVPTFIEMMGGTPSFPLEGRSLLPLLYQATDQSTQWREFVISEVDYSDRALRYSLELPPSQCWKIMVRTERWKYIEFSGFRPMLFDLENDPQERHDLGADPAYLAIFKEMRQHLVTWSLQRQARTTLNDEQVQNMTANFAREKRGILIGFWSKEELAQQMKGSSKCLI